MNEIIFWAIFIIGVVIVASFLSLYQDDLNKNCKALCGGLEMRFFNDTCHCKFHEVWFAPENKTTTGTTVK